MAAADTRNGVHGSAAGIPATMAAPSLHPAWQVFLRFCEQMKHGEIARLKIQDGLPMAAEVTTTKVKFSP